MNTHFRSISKMSAFPTLSSSTPMSDWFAGVTLLFHTVQQQAATIRTLQDRIVVLETRANIPIPVPPTEVTKKPNAKKAKALAAQIDEGAVDDTNLLNTIPPLRSLKRFSSSTVEMKVKSAKSEKKRGRKVEAHLADFLHEEEQVIARIPLGDRRFDEHAVTFRDGHLLLEDGQTFDHPTTMCSALAKMLEDIGERSTDCSKSVNGWILCNVSRDGKRVPLEKLKPAEAAEASEDTQTTSE